VHSGIPHTLYSQCSTAGGASSGVLEQLEDLQTKVQEREIMLRESGAAMDTMRAKAKAWAESLVSQRLPV
jgi:hypothetical protein